MSGVERGSVRVVAALLAACVLLVASASRASRPTVFHVHVAGVVNPIEARHVKRALERARAERAGLVLLSIDTPGGLVSSMQDIVSEITNSPVPVVGLVEPKTAQATSAGALILLATDVAAMLPDTRMGAAHPVGAGRPLEGATDQKATNSLASLAKSLALRRGRPAKLAEAIVRDSTSYTAEEAAAGKVVEFVVTGVDDLLARLDGHVLDFPDRKVTLATRSASRVDIPMSWANRVLDATAEPTVASILVTIGVLGILYELAAPGIGMGGIVGVTALLLGLLGMSVLPIRLAGVLLLAAGFVAIAIETSTPSHGLIGFGGIAATILGAIVLVDEARYFGPAQRVDWRVFAPGAVALGVGFLAVAAVARRAQRVPLQSGIETLGGARGIARTPVGQSGIVLVQGARWQAVSDSELPEGAEIEVVEVLLHPTRLRVKRLVKGES